MRTNDLRIPDAADVRPWDMSIARTGLLAVSAGALNHDGSKASLIMLFEDAGPPKRVIRTDPFVPIRITLSHDGHIWALGWNPSAEKTVPWPGTHSRFPPKDYGVFQKYSLDGRLVGEYVMRSSLPIEPLPHATARGELCGIRASATSVGADVPAADEWMGIPNKGGGEISGQKITRTSGKADDPPTLDYLAVTDSGGVYGAWSSGVGSTLYVLNRETGEWDLVAGSATARGNSFRLVHFLGSDGNRLVFKGGPVADFKSVVWFDQP